MGPKKGRAQSLSAGHQIFTRAPGKECWTLLKGIPGCGSKTADLRLVPEHDTKLTGRYRKKSRLKVIARSEQA